MKQPSHRTIKSCDIPRETRKMCISSPERPFAVAKFKAKARVWFVLFFLTGINRVPEASFLNRTPKEKLANEAAAGGKGPAHPRPWGDSRPRPAAGKPGEAI